jgi:hypothetical protein
MPRIFRERRGFHPNGIRAVGWVNKKVRGKKYVAWAVIGAAIGRLIDGIGRYRRPFISGHQPRRGPALRRAVPASALLELAPP